MVERGFTDTDPAAEVIHGDSGLRFFQHRYDLLFTKAAPFHDASPLTVLYPEKLSFGWTKFRGAGQTSPTYRNRRLSVIHLYVREKYTRKTEQKNIKPANG